MRKELNIRGCNVRRVLGASILIDADKRTTEVSTRLSKGWTSRKALRSFSIPGRKHGLLESPFDPIYCS